MPEFNSQNIGNALMGVGASLQGQGAQWAQGYQQQQERNAVRQEATADKMRALGKERKQALLLDNRVGLDLLKRGDLDGFYELGADRVENIMADGGDATETLTVMTKVRQGDVEGAINLMSNLDRAAVMRGQIPEQPGPAKPQYLTAGQVNEQGQAVRVGPDGQLMAESVGGYQADTGAQQDRELRRSEQELKREEGEANRALREQELQLKREEAARQAAKLPPTLQKVVTESVDVIAAAERNSGQYDGLAESILAEVPNQGGVRVTVNEMLKKALGTQDQDRVTELRNKFKQVRVSQGVKNLPQGSASDVDVALAMGPMPAENAPPPTMASYLRGQAKLERYNAGFNQLKQDFITKNRTGAGINQVWKKKIRLPEFDTEVTVADLYEDSVLMGRTLQETLDDFGITEELF